MRMRFLLPENVGKRKRVKSERLREIEVFERLFAKIQEEPARRTRIAGRFRFGQRFAVQTKREAGRKRFYPQFGNAA